MEKYFNNLKKYAFRLELLQEYNVDFDELDNWSKIIKDAKFRGVDMSRVHVVQKPFSYYLRYEIEAYRFSEIVGENLDIFIDLKNTLLFNLKNFKELL